MTTNQLTIPRPQTGEYAPYYQGYISLVSTDDILPVLETQWRETVALLSARKETEGDFRYAPGKWTVKEVLGHVIDCERIFGYRALRIARNDKTPMEGFEQEKVREILKLPLSYHVVALLGIGHLKGNDKFLGGRFSLARTVFAEEFGKPIKL